MKVVRKKGTQEIVYRSDPEFVDGMGIINAAMIKNYPPSELEEVTITQEQWDAYIATLPAVEMNSTIDTYLPSWNTVQTAVNNIANLTDAKAFILKLAKVVYWLAKRKTT